MFPKFVQHWFCFFSPGNARNRVFHPMLFHLPHPPSISTDLTFAPNLRVDIKSFHRVYLLFFLNSECLCWLLVQGIDTQLGASSRSAPGARAPELMRLNWSSSPVSSACRHSAPPSGEIPAWSLVGILPITAPLTVLYPRISVLNTTSARISPGELPFKGKVHRKKEKN